MALPQFMKFRRLKSFVTGTLLAGCFLSSCRDGGNTNGVGSGSDSGVGASETNGEGAGDGLGGVDAATGTGGASEVGGAGGAGDAGGTGTATSISVEAFAGEVNEYGFAWKSSFFLAPCYEVRENYCLTRLPGCPNGGPPGFEDFGDVFQERFKVGGEVGQTYSVTIRVNGIVSGKYFTGGTRRRGENYSEANAQAGTDTWYVGGEPTRSSYGSYKLSVFGADGTTELQHYYLNSFPEESGFQSHQTFSIGYEATFDVPGQGVIQQRRHNPSCLAINNCGPGEISGIDCPAPRHVPNEPDLEVPTMFGGMSVEDMNVVSGANQPYHSQIVHVTVISVELKQ